MCYESVIKRETGEAAGHPRAILPPFILGTLALTSRAEDVSRLHLYSDISNRYDAPLTCFFQT